MFTKNKCYPNILMPKLKFEAILYLWRVIWSESKYEFENIIKEIKDLHATTCLISTWNRILHLDFSSFSFNTHTYPHSITSAKKRRQSKKLVTQKSTIVRGCRCDLSYTLLLFSSLFSSRHRFPLCFFYAFYSTNN